MKKFLLFLLIFVVVVALLGKRIIFYALEVTLPSYVSEQLAKEFGTKVEVGSMTITSDLMETSSLTIANEPKSTLPQAFACKKISVTTPVLSLLSDDVNVSLITVEDVDLSFEFDTYTSMEGNWTRLMDNFSKNFSKTDKKSEKVIHIDKVVFKNIMTSVVYRDNPKKIIKLPLIEEMILNDISTEEGVPLSQIANSVLASMLKETFRRQGLKNMLNNIIDPFNLKDSVLNPLSPFFK